MGMYIVKSGDATSPAHSETGECIFELLGASAKLGGTKTHSIVRLELAPGASSPSVLHFHKQSEETYVILSGSAVIRGGDQKIDVDVGDIVAVGIGETHQITATGTSLLIALAIMAPGFSPDDVFEVLG